jgi:hypothetical protein
MGDKYFKLDIHVVTINIQAFVPPLQQDSYHVVDEIAVECL